MKNARIVKTFLGIKDHEIFTFVLHLDYGDSSQGFGTYNIGLKTCWGTECLKRILQTVGVDQWEGLPGKHCRAVIESGLVRKIGHIVEDKWFCPKEDLKEFEQ